jgi:hypothetical protein
MPSPHYFAVYHATNPLAMLTPEVSSWYEGRSGSYTHVADVVAPLEQVFALTNHIDHDWTSNLEVVWHAPGASLRSTSVGDVILDVESGQAWMIMPIGLQELPPERRTRANDAGTPFWVPSILTHFMRFVSRASIYVKGHFHWAVTMGVIHTIRETISMKYHQMPPKT